MRRISSIIYIDGGITLKIMESKKSSYRTVYTIHIIMHAYTHADAKYDGIA